MTPRLASKVLGALALLAVGTTVPGLTPAAAQTGPRITLDRSDVAPGEPLLVTFEGFESHYVNIVVCGNLAYRGSTDCNMTAGVSKETLSGGMPKLVELIAHPPPVHCPCIVRATASSGDGLAVAPLSIIGHPVADLVGVPEGPLVAVEVEVARTDEGLGASLRSLLGGRTSFDATVSVRNNTTTTLSRLALSGAVGHGSDDDDVVLDLDPPGELEPGQTWSQDVVAEVSAPSFGRYRFEVVASGAGAPVSGTTDMVHHPWLLYLFAMVLLADLVVMVGRWVARRDRGADPPEDDWDDDLDDLALPPPEPELTPV